MFEFLAFALLQLFTITGSPAASKAPYQTTTSASAPTSTPQQSADDDSTSEIGNEGWDND